MLERIQRATKMIPEVRDLKNKVDTYLRRTNYTKIKKSVLSISQWLPCPLAIWAFALDGNLVKSNKKTFNYNTYMQETLHGLELQLVKGVCQNTLLLSAVIQLFLNLVT